MTDLVIRQTVFDRLIGADLLYEGAGDQGRPPRNAAESIALLKRNLLRDLEWLLNARQVSDAEEIPLEHLKNSVFTFGLPELSSYDAASAANPEGLQQSIARSIERHEPRLRNVEVTPIELKNRFDRLVRFHIEGDLLIESEMERIEFDTVLKTSTKRFEVKEDLADD